ncbi:MAG: class I SAM-dependent methyltransferase [Chloroflexi bacterium]|nr:class I SAM-dependent methyltransferase [Chloroflexota bacterium]
MNAMTLAYPVEEWLNEAERIAYSDYWNDETAEREKPFWILDGDFGKMERYLAGTSLVQQLEECAAVLRQQFGRTLHGVGCDLAAGTLWAEPHLFRLGNVEKIYCIEYSRHRLLKLGPAVLEHYNISPEKIVLALGDFHRLKLQDGAVDFVFMSAAFHHSDAPEQLLREIRRVLKPEGVVILIGEHVADIRWKHYFTQPIKLLVARLVPKRWQRRIWGIVFETNSLLPNAQSRQIVDDGLGDHDYTLSQYAKFFSGAGFRYQCLRGRSLQAFVCVI